MNYTITPGNIAAVCHVQADGSTVQDCILLNEGKQPVVFLPGNGDGHAQREAAAFLALPLKVRAEVNKHFGTVFALPIEKRGAYLKQCVPLTVTTD